MHAGKQRTVSRMSTAATREVVVIVFFFHCVMRHILANRDTLEMSIIAGRDTYFTVSHQAKAYYYRTR